ncbi:MAG: NTP transferase domain-containing protein [Clostridia bacterium]|nr:NTP transferase domain-containing protein [Clostridia bacterium]
MTILVLAAGMGSRFGGIKQLTPLTDEGEYILDFTVYDAIRAGFDNVVFVIRRDIADIFEERIGAKLRRNGVKFTYAYQERELPEGYTFPKDRVKPFGTVQAVLSAGKIEEPLAVVNADDFYGYEPLKSVAAFLGGAKDEWCSVGYRLKNTLSENGTVSRGICETDAARYLTEITECKKITCAAGRVYNQNPDGSETALDLEDLVSMTCFGFTPDFHEKLTELYYDFLEKNKADFSTCEYLLSEALKQMLADGARVKVLETDAKWCGVTYKEDSERFRKFIAALKAEGTYPRQLWEKA